MIFSHRTIPLFLEQTYLILDATSGFSRSLHISSCRMLVDFSVEIKNVQYLSEVDDIFQATLGLLLTRVSKDV